MGEGDGHLRLDGDGGAVEDDSRPEFAVRRRGMLGQGPQVRGAPGGPVSTSAAAPSATSRADRFWLADGGSTALRRVWRATDWTTASTFFSRCASSPFIGCMSSSARLRARKSRVTVP